MLSVLGQPFFAGVDVSEWVVGVVHVCGCVVYVCSREKRTGWERVR